MLKQRLLVDVVIWQALVCSEVLAASNAKRLHGLAVVLVGVVHAVLDLLTDAHADVLGGEVEDTGDLLLQLPQSRVGAHLNLHLAGYLSHVLILDADLKRLALLEGTVRHDAACASSFGFVD